MLTAKTRTPCAKLVLFLSAYVWALTFSRSILPVYFQSQGLTFVQMFAGFVFTMLAPIILIPTIRRGSARTMWRIGILCSWVSIMLLLSIRSLAQFYIASFIGGMHLFFYMMYYNIAYFRVTPEEKTGINSAVMFSISSAISVVAPPVAGFVFQRSIGLFALLVTGFFLYAFTHVRRQENFTLSYNLREIFSAIRATRVFIILEGVWEAIIFAVIPIATLYFITTPVYYGAYLSYLAVVSIIANLLLGKYTDRARRRIIFLYPMTIALAIATFLFPQALTGVTLWIVVTGIIYFILPLFWNVTTAMVVDTQTNLPHAMAGRELCLALGRITGIGASLLSFLVEGTPKYLFYFLGSVMILYALLLFRSTKIEKKYSYV